MDELYYKVETWIESISADEAQPDSIKALYIGIFASDPHYQLYLVGSNEYDPDDDEWACNEDWGVDLPYFDTGISVVSQPWDMVLEAVVHTFELMVEKMQDSVLQWDVAVAVGFDDGSLVLIKEF